MRVFLLQHSHPLEDSEDYKVLGIYSSEGNALLAIDRYRRLPGFRDWPDGFSIDQWELDGDAWTEGFVTVVHD